MEFTVLNLPELLVPFLCLSFRERVFELNEGGGVMNQQRFVAYINFWGILVLSLALVVAYYFQFLMHEAPCPLCLLQRACLLGVAFGFLLNLRYGFKPSHYGMSVLSALLGAMIAGKHLLLWICPGPTGLTGYGLPFLGLHLYTWAFIFFAASILAVALLLMIPGQFKEQENALTSSQMRGMANFSFWLILILFVSNFFVTLVTRYLI